MEMQQIFEKVYVETTCWTCWTDLGVEYAPSVVATW